MKKLILAPFYMHKELLNLYRGKDQFFDVKLMSKEELIAEYKGHIEKEEILPLMKKEHLTYQCAKEILSYIPYVNSGLTPHLKYLLGIKENLTLNKNEYLATFFDGYELEIYGYSKRDKELKELINSFSLKASYHNFEQVKKLDVYKYQTIEDEVYSVLNKIASLIDSGEDINNIYIINKDESYLYYLRHFVSSFGFSINMDLSESLFEKEIAKQFLKEFVKTHDIKNSINFVKEKYEEDVSYLEEFNNEQIKELDFDQQLDYMVNTLKSYKIKSDKYINAVNVTSNPIYKENAHIFILGFAQGVFPSTYKDNAFISDKEKAIIGLNTSKEQCLIDEDVLSSFLFSNNHFYISYCEKSLSSSFYPSFLIMKYDFNVIEGKLPDIIYSSKMIDFYYGKASDQYRLYKEVTPQYFALSPLSKISYNTYDNQFTGVDVYSDKSYLKFSYSSIKTFNDCPFAYYLDKVLDLNEFEDTFYTKLGNITHKLLELCFDEDFDFEKKWEELFTTYEWEKDETLILLKLKPQIEQACNAAKLHKKYINNPEIKTEAHFEVKLTNYTTLQGNVDKTIIIDNKYLALVDYKTGNDAFKPKDMVNGYSMQLPTYAVLVHGQNEYKDYPIIGLYINNVIDSSYKESLLGDELIKGNLKLRGRTVADVNKISLIDSTIGDGSCSFISNLKIKKDGTISGGDNAPIASEEEIKQYEQMAIDFYLNADKEIRKNNFVIAPKFKGKDDNACRYCQYRDICFVKESQRIYIKNEEESEEEDDE